MNLDGIGIYKDNGLISITYGKGSLAFKIQNKVIKTFKYMGLKKEISSNSKIVNFLAVTQFEWQFL